MISGSSVTDEERPAGMPAGSSGIAAALFMYEKIVVGEERNFFVQIY